VVKSVRVGDISELSLVPSILMYSKIWYFLCVLVLCTQVNMVFVVLLIWCNITITIIAALKGLNQRQYLYAIILLYIFMTRS
jgi:hypothetical protein